MAGKTLLRSLTSRHVMLLALAASSMLFLTGCEDKLNTLYTEFMTLQIRAIVFVGVIVIGWKVLNLIVDSLQERQQSTVANIVQVGGIVVLVLVGLLSGEIVNFAVRAVGTVDATPPEIPIAR